MLRQMLNLYRKDLTYFDRLLYRVEIRTILLTVSKELLYWSGRVLSYDDLLPPVKRS